MRVPLASLKAEADALSAQTPRLRVQAGEASSAHPGAAGRRRAGQGESFWQYRRYGREDSAARIDWRRSARSDQLYVRETELESARTFLFWIDPSQSFHWTSDRNHPRKASRAAVIFMALANSLCKAGERVGALGGPRKPSIGPRASLRMAQDLWGQSPVTTFPATKTDAAMTLIASDFYTPIDTWRERIAPLASKQSRGVLLAIADPIEADYPFEGRVKFSHPGEGQTQLLGRAENVRADYLERLTQNRQALDDLAASLGWRLIIHTTHEDPRAPLGELVRAVMEVA